MLFFMYIEHIPPRTMMDFRPTDPVFVFELLRFRMQKALDERTLPFGVRTVELFMYFNQAKMEAMWMDDPDGRTVQRTLSPTTVTNAGVDADYKYFVGTVKVITRFHAESYDNTAINDAWFAANTALVDELKAIAAMGGLKLDVYPSKRAAVRAFQGCT